MKKNILILIAGFFTLLTACEQSNNESSFAYDEGLTVGDQLEIHNEFSIWSDLLKEHRLFDALTVSNSFTCFVPSNKTISEYAKEKGFESIYDLEDEDVEYLLKYHIIEGNELERLSMLNGKFSDTTASGDYLVSRYVSDLEVIINDRSTLVGSQIRASNGLLHMVDKCLDPIRETIADRLKRESRYSLFNELAVLTGADTAYFNKLHNERGFRNYSTLFVVPNEVFNADGIMSVEDAISRYSPYRDDYTEKSNPLHKYVAYHAIGGMQSFSELADFEKGPKVRNIATVAKGELITVQDIDGVLTFNYEEGKNPLTFYKDTYNIMARNGMIHEVSGVMPVYSPPPVTFKIEPTDANYFPEFASLEWYLRGGSAGQGKQSTITTEEFPYIRYHSIPEGVARVAYETRGTWMGNYFDNADVIVANCGPVGWWEMDFPAIIKGKYTVKMQIHKAYGRGSYQMAVDGIKVGAPVVFGGGGYTKMTVTVGIVNIRETGEPTIRFSVVKPGPMEIDYLIFEPIKD